MSISLLLIPAAIAGVTAVQAAIAKRDTQDTVVCAVQTRMRDITLLEAALRETGAAVGQSTTETLIVRWDETTARFDRGTDGVWSAHFTGDIDQDRAVEIIRSVDTAYGRQVQLAVLARLRERAPSAGLHLESEDVTANGEIRLVFMVERAA